jgi:hypothetical protein
MKIGKGARQLVQEKGFSDESLTDAACCRKPLAIKSLAVLPAGHTRFRYEATPSMRFSAPVGNPLFLNQH